MTQENKQLLLKDLCARLPYGTIIQVSDWTLLDTELKVGHISQLMNEDLKLKPYLRPMPSMTEEEENKYNSLNAYEKGLFPHTEEAFDWLNKHYFDYRGLIEKGLALEAPEGMYKKKEE